MSKALNVLSIICICCCFTSYAFGSADADPNALTTPVYEPLVNGKIVTLEVISVNGQKAPDKSVEKAIKTFSKYVAGEVRTVDGDPVQLGLGDDDALTKQQFESIVDGAKHHGQCAIIIVIAADFDFFYKEGDYSYQWSSDGDIQQSIKLNARVIDESAPEVPMVSRETFWQMVTLHELCHALGVPAHKSHSWSNDHCTNPRCILYPKVDGRSISASILHLGPPLDLCKTCRAEIRKAQKAASGKFYDPSQPYDRSEEVVRLNPGNPKAYLFCATENLKKRDYQKVITNCSRAISADPNCSEGYILRAMANHNLENDAKAADDFKEAIRISPSHVSALQMLAWLLSTSPESDLRDGGYAIELAARACELTKWKNPSCLHCLAAAHAEIGSFQTAIKYEAKALSLMGESTTEDTNKMLEAFQAGRPYREPKGQKW